MERIEQRAAVEVVADCSGSKLDGEIVLMDGKTGVIILMLLGLFALNNAIFPGLDKENRVLLGAIGLLIIGCCIFYFVG